MDEDAARSAAALVVDGNLKMGLEGPIPIGLPGHRIAPHVETREFPLRYVTPEIRRFMRLWRLHDRGLKIREDGVLHWPARLAQAIDLIDREMKARRKHAEVK
jgi:hypothetical protein